MASLGTKLLKIRQKYKLSQSEVSEKLGVSQNAYSRWEADTCKPHVENLLKISKYYQIDMNELLDENNTINFSGKQIKGGDILTNNKPTINTINIQLSTELIERFFQTHEQIFLLIDSQFKNIVELLKKRS